jgi:hypothetical protein
MNDPANAQGHKHPQPEDVSFERFGELQRKAAA